MLAKDGFDAKKIEEIKKILGKEIVEFVDKTVVYLSTCHVRAGLRFTPHRGGGGAATATRWRRRCHDVAAAAAPWC